MNAYQKALYTIACYIANNCEPIKRSDERVTINQTGEYSFEINFRNWDYYDYYNEKDKYFQMNCTYDLQSHLDALIETLPSNYRHDRLCIDGEVSEKGYCYVTVALDDRPRR